MKRITILLPICLFVSVAKAQDKNTLEREKIDDLFYKSINRGVFKDTNMVYMFAFRVEVAINKKGLAEISKISSNDSVAHKIYKDWNFLKQIDYPCFMQKGQKKATFIFPVAIFLEYPDKPHTGFINMQDVQNKLEKLWDRTDYSKEPTENYIYIPALNLRTSTVESD